MVSGSVASFDCTALGGLGDTRYRSRELDTLRVELRSELYGELLVSYKLQLALSSIHIPSLSGRWGSP